jgi:hypothetical protein
MLLNNGECARPCNRFAKEMTNLCSLTPIGLKIKGMNDVRQTNAREIRQGWQRSA